MLDGVLVLKYYHRFEYYLASLVMTELFSNSVSPQIKISQIQDRNLASHHPQFISFRRIPLLQGHRKRWTGFETAIT